MKIPLNLLKTNYTLEGEFIFLSNYKPYQGYYYELNEKYFVGKEFNPNSPELIKINSNKINSLLSDSKTFTYGSVSKIKINNNVPSSFIYNYKEEIRYFIFNTIDKVIKEIDKITFYEFQNNPLYISVALDFIGGFDSVQIYEAEKKIPGLKVFIDTSYISPSIEEEGSIG